MSTLAVAPAAAVSRMRLFTWRYPEWWVLAVCAAAWASILFGVGHGHGHAGFAALRLQLIAWMAMTVAMMLPAVVPQMRWIAQGSFWNRRHRAIAGFVLGYLLPWIALGLLASLLLSARWAHAAAVPVGLFLLAAAWQRTPAYRSARRVCHRTVPLAPLGWRADRDCLRYGSMIGMGCVRSCWPLMLACAATGHGLVAMAGGCLLGLLEATSLRSPSRTMLAGTLGLALFYAALSALGAGAEHQHMRM